MGMFFNTELNSLDDLLLLEINDLYDAEQRIVEATCLKWRRPRNVAGAQGGRFSSTWQKRSGTYRGWSRCLSILANRPAGIRAPP